MSIIMLTERNESLTRQTDVMLVNSALTNSGIFALIPDSPTGARTPDRTFTRRQVLHYGKEVCIAGELPLSHPKSGNNSALNLL